MSRERFEEICNMLMNKDLSSAARTELIFKLDELNTQMAAEENVAGSSEEKKVLFMLKILSS